MTTHIRKLVWAGAVLAAATPVFAHLDQHAKIIASDGIAGDLFGHSVAVSTDLIVAGAPAQDIMGADSGAVYVFERAGLAFNEHTKLLAFDGAPTDRFGESVALSGHTIVVGAPQDDDLGTNSGAAYVYVENAGVWTLEAKLLAPDGLAGDEFGFSVDVEGDRILVGAPHRDMTGIGNDVGAAYVFIRTGTTWAFEWQFLATDPGPRHLYGYSVAIAAAHEHHTEHADWRAAAGSPQDSWVVPFGGSAYSLKMTSGVFSTEAKVVDANAQENDRFGTAVDIFDAMMVVGSPGDDDFVPDGGSIFVFEESHHTWPQTQHKYGVAATNPTRLLGSSVAVSEGMVIGGAPREDILGNTDAGEIYFWDPTDNWLGEVAKADDPTPNAQLGASVAVGGAWMVSGAEFDDDNGVNSGAVYVYLAHMHMDTYCTAGTSASGCQASIGAQGIPCASAPSGFALYANNVEGQKDGLFFFSANGQQAQPWYSSTSFQCVVAPVIRTPTMPGTGTLGACDGLTIIDMNALWTNMPNKNPGESTINAQFWYRDPLSTSGTTTSLSDAINFQVIP
jgi:hypothetical protein